MRQRQEPEKTDWHPDNEAEHVERHGVPFNIASAVFVDENRVEAEDRRKDYGERRWTVVGMVDGICINVTFTMIGTVAWIISARAAHRKEGNDMVRKTLAELRADPPKFSTEQRARVDAMTQEEIDSNADTDPVNPTMTEDMLERAVFARDVRLARKKSGLTQSVFAERYHIAVSRLRDWERGRYRPDSVAVAYIKAIRHNPRAIERALEAQD